MPKSNHRRCSIKKAVPKSFAFITGKHRKSSDWGPATLLKRNFNTDVFCEYGENFKNCFEKHLRTTFAFVYLSCFTNSPLEFIQNCYYVTYLEKTTLKKPSLIRVEKVCSFENIGNRIKQCENLKRNWWVHCFKSVRIRSYSDPYFSAFRLNTKRYGVSLRISSKCGKIRTRAISNTDTFYGVVISWRSFFSAIPATICAK